MNEKMVIVYRRIVKGKKLFFKMLASYAFLSIIPVVIAIVLVFNFISNILIDDAHTKYKKSLDQMVYDTDRYMENIYNVSRILSENSKVHVYGTMDIKDTASMEFFRFVDDLYSYKNIYSGVDSIYLYYNDRVITSENGMRLIDNFDDASWCKKVIGKAKENYKYLVPYVDEPRKRFNRNNENRLDYYDIISVVSPIGGRYYDRGMIVVNIREQSFRKGLNKLKQNNYDQIYILDKNTGNIISKSDSTSSFENISNAELLNYVKEIGQTNTENTIQFNDKKAVIAVSYSAISDWVYVSLSDYKVITERVTFIRNVFTLYLLVLCIIGFIASVVIVGRIYAPIKNIVSNILNMQAKPDTDEVSSIRNYINQILTTSNYNKQILSKNLPSIKENIFFNLLRGRIVDEKDITEKLKLCGIEMNNHNYMTAVIAIDAYSIFVERYSLQERLNFKYYLLQVVEEKLNEHALAYGLETDQDKICFIINLNEDLKTNSIKDLFRSIKGDIYNNTDITFTVGIGKSYNNMDGIRNSYVEALDALKERFSLGEDNIIYTGDLENKRESFYTHVKLEEELINCIYAGNEDKISDIIQRILKEAGIKGLKSEKVRQILLEVVSFIGRQLFKTGVTYEDIFKGEGNFLAGLEKCETLAQMEAYINNMLISVSKYVRSEDKSDVNIVIEKVKEYIGKNYSTDLSLSQVADVVKLSPSYLSTVFYKETQYNFVEYLNMVRINKAKELLMDSNLSIKDVSNNVGYSNYNTFSKAFKKYTGISAKQFRYEKGIMVDE